MKICATCGKGSQLSGKYNKLRGKYNPAPKTRRYPNLQWLSVPAGTTRKNFRIFAGQRVLVCTECIRTLAKPK